MYIISNNQQHNFEDYNGNWFQQFFGEATGSTVDLLLQPLQQLAPGRIACDDR